MLIPHLKRTCAQRLMSRKFSLKKLKKKAWGLPSQKQRNTSMMRKALRSSGSMGWIMQCVKVSTRLLLKQINACQVHQQWSKKKQMLKFLKMFHHLQQMPIYGQHLYKNNKTWIHELLECWSTCFTGYLLHPLTMHSILCGNKWCLMSLNHNSCLLEKSLVVQWKQQLRRVHF